MNRRDSMKLTNATIKLQMPITYVAGIHGNETLPIFTLQEFGIPFLLGNPEAVKQNKRYIEKDLNASFGTEGDSLEEERARSILERIDSNSIVVDFHTTTAPTEPFVVVVNPEMIPFAKTLGIQNIVYMHHNIKDGHSLINFRNGVSVETGQHQDTEGIKVIKKVISKQKVVTRLFEVYDIIKTPGNFINFKDTGLGFIPILAGKNSYDFYGLKARLI